MDPPPSTQTTTLSPDAYAGGEEDHCHHDESDNVLQKHVAFFDRNKGGLVYPWETFQGCRTTLSIILSSADLMAAAKGPPPYSKYITRDHNPDPKTCALLVIDVQNHFSSVANPIIPQLNTTVQLCRRYSIPVIFTRHAEMDPEEYPMLAEWWGNDLITEGTEAWQLIPELDVRPAEDTLLAGKYTYSAFRGTGLEDQLKVMGVREVIVTGVMTNLCCETTARDAFVRGFRVFFSTDATATSCEELHDATLMNLAYGFAYLVDCDSLNQKLS